MGKWGAAAAAVVASTLVVGVSIAPSEAASDPARQTGKIVSTNPDDNTPDILGDEGTNSVFSIAKVGNQVVVGGKFSQVKDNSTGQPLSGQTLDRTNAFAFDAETGAVSPTFKPDPSGQVDRVLAARDGKSVFLGGAFRGVRPGPPTTSTPMPMRVTAERLAKFTVSSGKVNPTFKPAALDRRVLDLETVGSRLWVAGRFTHVGSAARGGIVALDPVSGTRSSYFKSKFAGVHNPDYRDTQGTTDPSDDTGPSTFVKGIAVNPAGTAVVAIGNFTTVDGKARVQAAKFALGRSAASLSSWSTPQFRQSCKPDFETNMTDVQYSPNGSYFVVSTTGGYGGIQHSEGGISGCDVVTRFAGGTATHGSRPTWSAYTGGDTTWTIEVTDNVVYVGGHQRWQNNPSAGQVKSTGDVAGPGAVSRYGHAALDPLNGLPYSWNPTRRPGRGVQDFLATDDGLYVGSDTDTIGHETHGKIAFLPLEGGADLPRAVSSPGLSPATVYTVRNDTTPLVKRNLRQGRHGFVVSGPSDGATGTNAPDWSNVVGAFMIRGDLYTGERDGTLTKRTFDGNSYGAPTQVTAGDALVRQAGWHDGDVPNLTSIFYYHGFLYYTLSGDDNLYRRAFEIEDDLVGQLRSATKLSNPDVNGAFVAGGKYFFAGKRGYLSSMKWGSNGPTGKATAVSGPRASLGSQNWASKVAFVYQGG